MHHDARIKIDSRFCGPPGSGNGGYVSGRLAGFVRGIAAVRLKAPPPLETAMRVEIGDGIARLFDASTLVAEAREASLDLQAPPAPVFEEAERASRSYAGFRVHPFPTCFVCGPARTAGDGLRIFPGAASSRNVVAAPWIPDKSLADASGRVDRAFLWAALDCTGAFVSPHIESGRAIVLGELCARIDDDLVPGEPCIATAWAIGAEGRKSFAGSAVHRADGRAVAVARATWIEVPARDFSPR
jgi:hypothetical protein